MTNHISIKNLSTALAVCRHLVEAGQMPKVEGISDEELASLIEDARHFDSGVRKVVLTGTMENWLKFEGEEVPPEEDTVFDLLIDLTDGNQQPEIMVVPQGAENPFAEFAASIFLENNHGMPALHLSYGGCDDNAAHIHFRDDGIEVVSDDRSVATVTESRAYPGNEAFLYR